MAGAPPSTIAACGIDLRQFARHLEGRGLAVDDVGEGDLLGFLAELEEKGASPATLRRKVASLASFFRFLMREGICNRNPVTEIELPYGAGLRASELLAIELRELTLKTRLLRARGREHASAFDRLLDGTCSVPVEPEFTRDKSTPSLM